MSDVAVSEVLSAVAENLSHLLVAARSGDTAGEPLEKLVEESVTECLGPLAVVVEALAVEREALLSIRQQIDLLVLEEHPR